MKKTYVEPVNLIWFRVQISNLQVTKVFIVNLTQNWNQNALIIIYISNHMKVLTKV